MISKSLAFAVVLAFPFFLRLDKSTFAKVCAVPSNSNGLDASVLIVPLALNSTNLSFTSSPFVSYAFKSAVTTSFTILNSAVTLDPVKFLFPSTGFNTTVPFPEIFSP